MILASFHPHNVTKTYFHTSVPIMDAEVEAVMKHFTKDPNLFTFEDLDMNPKL